MLFLAWYWGILMLLLKQAWNRMLTYSWIDQTGYVIIGIIIGDPNDGYASMIIILFCIFMNVETFACIVLFDLHTDNNRDYTR